MTRPHRFLLPMIILLGCITVASVLLWKGLSYAFFANVFLNSIIFAVLLFGIGYSFFQVLRLNPEVAWIEGFRRNQPGLSLARPPRLLAPMATMLGERKGRISLSAVSMRSLLDTIGTRLDELRDLGRYLIGLMIFLGLLGTFWGLLETVGAVSGVIAGLSTATDVSTLFNDLQTGLKAPLSGMGTAFGTSLLGLAGSLVLGFLDLQAGRAQNRFYNELEEWLSSLTRLSSGGPVSDGDQPIPAYIQALLEQTADNLENLQRTMARAEDSRVVRHAGDRVPRRPADAADRADARRADTDGAPRREPAGAEAACWQARRGSGPRRARHRRFDAHAYPQPRRAHGPAGRGHQQRPHPADPGDPQRDPAARAHDRGAGRRRALVGRRDARHDAPGGAPPKSTPGPASSTRWRPW